MCGSYIDAGSVDASHSFRAPCPIAAPVKEDATEPVTEAAEEPAAEGPVAEEVVVPESVDAAVNPVVEDDATNAAAGQCREA